MDKRTEKFIKSVLGVKSLDEAKIGKQPENANDAVHVEAIPEDEIARQFQENEKTLEHSNTINDNTYDSELLNRELSSDREDDKFSPQLGDDEQFLTYSEWKDYVKEVCFQVNKSFLTYLYKKRISIKEDLDDVK